MRRRAHLTRRARVRFLVPLAAVAAIALAAWIPTVTASASTPNLRPLRAEQVVAKALGARVAGFSGSVRWTSNLGIPDLGSLVGGVTSNNGLSVTSLISGTHTVKVWDAGADRQRLALAGSLSEVDLVHNGSRAWYYDSNTDTVTDLVAAPGSASRAGGDQSQVPALTPDRIATTLLSHLTPTTEVTVVAPVYVAGRATYQLALSPAPGTKGATASTVRQIAIAVDATNGMPLRVEVFARGQKAPALEIGFTSVSFTVPSASEFRPLSGSTVRTRTIGGSASRTLRSRGPDPLELPRLGGLNWGGVAVFPHANLGPEAGQLLQATTYVTGSFGGAQLFQTSLLNALILPNGSVLAGFVTPSALEAFAANNPG